MLTPETTNTEPQGRIDARATRMSDVRYLDKERA